MSRLFLQVPDSHKDIARKKGARWDPNGKRWFVPDGLDSLPFIEWVPELREHQNSLSILNIISLRRKNAAAGNVKKLNFMHFSCPGYKKFMVRRFNRPFFFESPDHEQ
jgi:hypothetical protein